MFHKIPLPSYCPISVGLVFKTYRISKASKLSLRKETQLYHVFHNSLAFCTSNGPEIQAFHLFKENQPYKADYKDKDYHTSLYALPDTSQHLPDKSSKVWILCENCFTTTLIFTFFSQSFTFPFPVPPSYSTL